MCSVLKSSRTYVNVKEKNCYANVSGNTQQLKPGGWLWFTESVYVVL
jgi:hypothetical protein